jgi:hypothetical protein
MFAEIGLQKIHPARQGIRRLGVIAIGLVLLCCAFLKPQIDGDGLEYVMMAHAFYRHATPEIRQSDIAEIMALPGSQARTNGLPTKLLAEVPQKLGQSGAPFAGFAGGGAGGIHAIHFWMYSLLAAPFHAVAVSLGLNPALAFAALNLLIVGLSAGLILRWLPKAGLTELVILALLGPVFYLRWTGPEIFSACCALLATLAMIRRDAALAMFLAGFGATQNPAIAGLILAAGASWGLFALRPGWALRQTTRTTRTRNTALGIAGIVLAVLPYVHNEIVFGMPSIIAVHFTDPRVVSRERLSSFFFDLNQGLIAGFPGLVLGAVLLAALLDKTCRFRWLAYAVAACCLTLGLAFPSLAAVNWNNGYIVVLRYAYWAVMPVVAVCMIGLGQLSAARRRAVLAGIVVCQALTMWQANWPRNSGYLKHSRLASWVLDHAPQLYHPDPEVFFERETHKEQELARDRVIVHHGAGGPTKLMRSWLNTEDSGGVCPPQQVILSAGAGTALGWEYFDAPFQCGQAKQQGADWLLGAAGSGQAALLKEGWSGLEPAGVWTEGSRSVLTIPLAPGKGFRRLGIDGAYLRPGTMTDLTINDVHLGPVRLGAGPIALPPSVQHASALRIVLLHPHPVSPASLGMSDDKRPLAFFLRRIHLDDGTLH